MIFSCSSAICLLRNTVRMSAFVAVSAFAASAQTPAAPAAPDYVPTLTFDVASVRESVPTQTNGVRVGVVSPPHSCKFTATSMPAKGLLQAAYGFGTPVLGGPDWLNDHYFTVEAKCDHSVDEQMAKLTDDQSTAEKRHMLQTLLADRFHLKGHTEIKESSVYTLSIAKGGPKLHEVKVDTDDPNHVTPANAGLDLQAHGGAQGLEFVAHTANMKAIAAMLTSQIEKPVVDHTGLPGYYDFTLQFGRPWSASNPESWPDIVPAVQEQLGLKLDSVKAPTEVYIIDHMEMPPAN